MYEITFSTIFLRFFDMHIRHFLSWNQTKTAF